MRVLICSLLLLFVTTPSFAQDFHVGANGGVNILFPGKNDLFPTQCDLCNSKIHYFPTIYSGVRADVMFNWFYLSAELAYSRISHRSSYNIYYPEDFDPISGNTTINKRFQYTRNFDFIEVPLHAGFYFKNFRIYTGFSNLFGIGAVSKGQLNNLDDGSISSFTNKDRYNKYIPSISSGLGYDVPIGKSAITIDFRYRKHLKTFIPWFDKQDSLVGIVGYKYVFSKE